MISAAKQPQTQFPTRVSSNLLIIVTFGIFCVSGQSFFLSDDNRKIQLINYGVFFQEFSLFNSTLNLFEKTGNMSRCVFVIFVIKRHSFVLFLINKTV